MRTRRDWPFRLDAVALLPDHLHVVLTLPDGNGDFSTRVAAIKAHFTTLWLRGGGAEACQSAGRARKAYRGVWQARFWEHLVRDEAELADVLDYVHYNPVKHGHVRCPHAWAWSSFHRLVRERMYSADWLCVCGGQEDRGRLPRDIVGAEMDA